MLYFEVVLQLLNDNSADKKLFAKKSVISTSSTASVLILGLTPKLLSRLI
jgi:hypothetical protein